MKQIEVVAAIIRKGDKMFATQRGYGEWMADVRWLRADVRWLREDV